MKREKSEFGQVLIDVARVTRVVKGGRRFRFRAAVVIGNKKGKVGFGVAKGPDVSVAMSKAFTKAKQNIVEVLIVNDTIPHEITYKNGASIIFLKPAPKGTGIIAGSAVRPVIELSGIKNIFSKVHGTSNKINNAKTVIKALQLQRNAKLIAHDRGIDATLLGWTPRSDKKKRFEKRTDKANKYIQKSTELSKGKKSL